ncbi:MAG: glycerol-3-phosphate 1-O-acyltransferase PlsY [Proteobacteria bacterium]|nr:glycerol-3-phosphate 1-O-acyltransferase PlsY [Pseudomonadota bacterium]MBU1743042.1 glycerol-3-phosphate 1-O-acyltransferase PlsY [Pseudomonadota bacterium]
MSIAGLSLALAAYLVASIPFGLLLARALGKVDPREGGSGNVGTINVARTAGKTAAIFTLCLDAAKGGVPVGLSLWLFSPLETAVVGLAAFLGHVWPVYLRFRGGKGVATVLGILLVVSPWAGIATTLTVPLLGVPSGFMSVGSMVACLLAPVWLLILGEPIELVVMSVILAFLVVWRHRENISRLLSGKEHHWRKKHTEANSRAPDELPDEKN